MSYNLNTLESISVKKTKFHKKENNSSMNITANENDESKNFKKSKSNKNLGNIINFHIKSNKYYDKSEISILKYFKLISLQEAIKKAFDILPNSLKPYLIIKSKKTDLESTQQNKKRDTTTSNLNNINPKRSNSKSSQIKRSKSIVNSITNTTSKNNNKKETEFDTTRIDFYSEFIKERENILLSLNEKNVILKQKISNLKDEVNLLSKNDKNRNKFIDKSFVDNTLSLFDRSDCKNTTCLHMLLKFNILRCQYDKYAFSSFKPE